MSIESPVLTGLVGGVVGFVSGAIAGAKIQSLRYEIDKNKAIAKLGGISAEDHQELNGLYQTVLGALARDLDAESTGIKGLSEEILTYAEALCLPKNVPGESFARVPNLRHGLPDKEDLLGTRAAAFEYFDAYYREKGEETDKYVAQVRVLDNLHTLLLRYIDIVKKQPGQKAATVLHQLGKALITLQDNFALRLSHRRQFEALNQISTTKRHLLIALLRQEDDALMAEALTAQRQITLTESCQVSMDHMIETASLMGEFFLRTLDKNASEASEALGIAKMAQKEIRREITQENLRTVSPVGEVVAAYLRETASFKDEGVSDRGNSFQIRRQRDKSLSVATAAMAPIKNAHLPLFMQQKDHFWETGHSVDPAIFTDIAAILSLLNTALALEEEMKCRADSWGKEGLRFMGEFEVRRMCIETFYQHALNKFQRLLQTHPYYQGYFYCLSAIERLYPYRQSLVPQKFADALVILPATPDLKAFLPDHIDRVANIFSVGVLEKLAAQTHRTQAIQAEISILPPPLSGIPFHHACDGVLPPSTQQFLTEIASFCASDALLNEALQEVLTPLRRKNGHDRVGQCVTFLEKHRQTVCILKTEVATLQKAVVPLVVYLDNPSVTDFLREPSRDESYTFLYLKDLQRKVKYCRLKLEQYFGLVSSESDDDFSCEQQAFLKTFQQKQPLLKPAEAHALALDTIPRLTALEKVLEKALIDYQNEGVPEEDHSVTRWEAQTQKTLHHAHCAQQKSEAEVKLKEEALRAQQSHITQLEIARDQEIEKNQALTTLNAQIEAQNKDLKNHLETTGDNHAVVQAGLERLEAMNTEIRQKNEALTQETQTLETFALKLLERTQYSIEKLSGQMHNVQAWVKSLEALLTAPRTEETDTTEMEKLKALIVGQLGKLKDMITDIEADLNKTALELPNANEKLQAKLKEVQQLLVSQKDTITASDKKIAELTDHLAEAYKQIAALQEKVKRQNALIEQQKAEIKKLENTPPPSVVTVEDTLTGFQQHPSQYKKIEIKTWLSNPKFIQEMYALHHHRNAHLPRSSTGNVFSQDTRLAFLIEWIGHHCTAQDLHHCFQALGSGAGQGELDKSRLKAMRDLSELLHVYHRFLDGSKAFPSGQHPLKKISKAAGAEARIKLNPGFLNHRKWGRHWQYVSLSGTQNVSTEVSAVTVSQAAPPLPVWKKSASRSSIASRVSFHPKADNISQNVVTRRTSGLEAVLRHHK